VQFESHVPPQCDCPSQVELHPAAQSRLHEFFDAQVRDALLARPASEVPPSAPRPSEHVPPDAHVHVALAHEQEPAQSRGDVDAPEHEGNNPTTASGRSIRASMPIPPGLRGR
jgi:hypothetical protein